MLFPTRQAVLISHYSHKSATRTFFNPKEPRRFAGSSAQALLMNTSWPTHCKERQKKCRVKVSERGKKSLQRYLINMVISCLFFFFYTDTPIQTKHDKQQIYAFKYICFT